MDCFADSMKTDGFQDIAHKANDLSTYTLGIGGNVHKETGLLASFEDGYSMTGGFFYLADYGILLDYGNIDGVVEHLWKGTKHVHGTASSVIKDGFTHFGSSTQLTA
jgi:hypothetical protein